MPGPAAGWGHDQRRQLLIPPAYILTTMLFTDMKSWAWAFGVIRGMGGIGAADAASSAVEQPG